MKLSLQTNNSEDLKTTPMVLIIKDVCLVLEIRVDVPNKIQKESIQRRGGDGPKKKKVDDNNSSTTHKKVVDVNMVDDAAEKNKVEGNRLFDMGIFAELVKDLLCPVCCDSRLYVSTDLSKRKGLSCYIIEVNLVHQL